MMLTDMHHLPLVCEEGICPVLSRRARLRDAEVNLLCSKAQAPGADGAGVAAAAAAVQAPGRNGPVQGQEGASGGGGAQAGERDFGQLSALLPTCQTDESRPRAEACHCMAASIQYSL